MHTIWHVRTVIFMFSILLFIQYSLSCSDSYALRYSSLRGVSDMPSYIACHSIVLHI